VSLLSDRQKDWLSDSSLSESEMEGLFRPLLMSVHYLSVSDMSLLRKAFEFSVKAHHGQHRKSGEPYVEHPIAVATICAERFLDVETLCAALLHDVLEDTGVSSQELESAFGRTVTLLVQGLSKLNKTEGISKQAAQAINLSRMLHAMKQDVRVILIKLADRLHNMRTLSVMSPAKRFRIARETLDVYAPMAHRLGLFELYRELEDLSFQHCYPLRFNVLMRAVHALGVAQEHNLSLAAETLRQALAAKNLVAKVEHRIKHLWSLYRKMRDRHIPLHQVEDVFGIRVILQHEDDCYKALGVLHRTYPPVPRGFKDYIARPKNNGYQSLHTVLLGPQQIRLEVQVRTEQMHRIAEEGVAAHWMYKDGGALRLAQEIADPWLSKLLEIEANQVEDPLEYVDLIKTDLFPDLIYVHTPKHEIKALPRGSTVVDFAYAVHTQLGNHCFAAKVNREMTALRTILKNGDVVEVMTAEHASPHVAWLSFVRTGRAKLYIRQFLRKAQQNDLIRLGQSRLSQSAKSASVDIDMSGSGAGWEKILSRLSFKEIDALWVALGQGQLLPSLVLQQWLAAEDIAGDGKDSSPSPLVIQGTEGLAVELSPCCYPVPGDLIVGKIRKQAGLAVHRQECSYAYKAVKTPKKHGDQSWVELSWHANIPTHVLYTGSLLVEIQHVKGVLALLVQHIAKQGINIVDLSAQQKDAHSLSLRVDVQVHHLAELEVLLRSLRHQTWVIHLQRLIKEKK
jgi:guanosine-3',5'-bis(diphosphate) 3'-pyrophosphohydrolase